MAASESPGCPYGQEDEQKQTFPTFLDAEPSVECSFSDFNRQNSLRQNAENETPMSFTGAQRTNSSLRRFREKSRSQKGSFASTLPPLQEVDELEGEKASNENPTEDAGPTHVFEDYGTLVSPLNSDWGGGEAPARQVRSAKDIVLLMMDDPFGTVNSNTKEVLAGASPAGEEEEEGEEEDGEEATGSLLLSVAQWYALLSVCLTLAAATIVMVASAPKKRSFALSTGVEVAHTGCIAFFTIDFLVRVAVTPSWKEVFQSFVMWTDCAAVVPFYIYHMDSTDIASPLLYCDLTMFRLVRMMVTLSRWRLPEEASRNIDNLTIALTKSQEVLLLYFVVLLVTLVIWSTAMYYVERMSLTWWDEDLEQLVRRRRLSPPMAAGTTPDGVPRGDEIFRHAFDPDYDEVSPYQSVFHSMWWCIATLTTVGYGDVVPSSWGGRLIAGLTMISGIFVLALPTSILGSNFICLHKKGTEYSKMQLKNFEISPSDTITNNKIAHIFSVIENMVQENFLTHRQAEYIRRACWHPEYRLRIIWAYSATELMCDQKRALSAKNKIRYVGFVSSKTHKVYSPELRRRYRQSGNLALPQGCMLLGKDAQYVTFLFDQEGGVATDVVQLDTQYHREAQIFIQNGDDRVWLKLFRLHQRDPNDEVRAIYRKQETAANSLEKLETAMYARFVYLLGVVTDFLESLS